MQLLHLDVQSFGAIGAATLDFGPGLNVLYGPNDLGKSTLAAAIRAALLLPATSKAHSRWIPWTRDDSPTVELVFRTAPRRIWRVRKTFGSGGQSGSVLEASRDGESFETIAKGRQVDGELRRLLRWGIPEPGERGAPKGVPETFLTSALLAGQDQVAEIFDKALDDDPDTSSRERLTEALQALAQDPLFGRVLEAAQAKTDEAFTASGRKKSGRGSPFVRLREQIRQADERIAELRSQAEESDELRGRLARLQDERLERRSAVEAARAELARAEEAHQAGDARRELASRLDEARDALERIDAAHRAVADAEAQETELAERLAACTKALDAALSAEDTAAEELRRAEERLREHTSDAAKAQRAIEQERLENRRHQVQAGTEVARQRVAQARAVGDATAEVQRLEAEVDRQSQAVTGARRELEAHTEATEAARAEIDSWRHLRAFLRVRQAEDAQRRAGEAAERAAHLRRKATTRRNEATELRERLAETPVPDATELAELRRLREELRVVEARLEVGLSMALKPKGNVDVRFSRDGEPEQTETLGSFQVTLEAQRRIKLEVEDLLEIRVAGGTQEAREEVEVLRNRWQRQAEPWLDKAGVATVEELDAACRTAEERARRAASLEHEAEGLETQAAGLDTPSSEIMVLEERFEAARADLEAFETESELEALARRAEEIDARRAEDVEGRMDAADVALDAASTAEAGRQAELAGRESRLQGLKDELGAAKGRLAEARKALGGEKDWERIQRGGEATLSELATDLAALERQLGKIPDSQEGPDTELQARHDQAAKTLDAARASHRQQRTSHDETSQKLERLRGELALRRDQLSSLDRDAAQQHVAELEAQLAEITGREPHEGASVDEALAEAQHRLEVTESALAETEAEARRAQGALSQVGGDVVKERLDGEDQARDKLLEEEHELDLTYNAWRLLRDTLREAETERAAHLGRALVEPVSERFRDLTRGRYGDLVLGPDLRTHGVQAGGGAQDVKSLSIGTRDQLSTLLRLSLAQQLESVLLLDDQLTQSDPRSMGWFHDLLRDCAAEVQILVLTCRPDEYLAPGEMAGAEVPVLEAGVVRAVDLERLMTQSR